MVHFEATQNFIIQQDEGVYFKKNLKATKLILPFFHIKYFKPTQHSKTQKYPAQTGRGKGKSLKRCKVPTHSEVNYIKKYQD